MVSYDVPYGPREQISDGVDGFIVPDSDIDGAAARVIQLLDDPDLVVRMGAEGRRKALLHDENHFLADWAQVLNRVEERAPRRLQLTSLTARAERSSARPIGSAALELSGRLRVDSNPASADPSNARLSLVAVDSTRGGFVELPLSVQHRDRDFDLSATVAVRALMRSRKDLRRATLQLRLDWENAHWRTVVSSPEPVDGRGVKQNRRGVVVLRRVRAKKRAAPAKPPPRRRSPMEKVVGRLTADRRHAWPRPLPIGFGPAEDVLRSDAPWPPMTPICRTELSSAVLTQSSR